MALQSKDDYPIPQSKALSEAQPESLQELFSRNPESFYESKEAFEAVIRHMRQIGEKLAQSAIVKQPRIKQGTTIVPRQRVAEDF